MKQTDRRMHSQMYAYMDLHQTGTQHERRGLVAQPLTYAISIYVVLGLDLLCTLGPTARTVLRGCALEVCHHLLLLRNFPSVQ